MNTPNNIWNGCFLMTHDDPGLAFSREKLLSYLGNRGVTIEVDLYFGFCVRVEDPCCVGEFENSKLLFENCFQLVGKKTFDLRQLYDQLVMELPDTR